MKLISLVPLLAMAALARPLKPRSEYSVLNELCMTTSESVPNTYVAVLYQENQLRTYAYGQCYPAEIGGAEAVMAVFCKTVTCYSHPNPDCTGGDSPSVGVPVPAGLALDNLDNVVALLGQGAICDPGVIL